MPRFDFDRIYYIAGPMSGYENYNYPSFETALQALEGFGIQVRSPHTADWPPNHKDLSDEELWTYMMAQTKKMLEECSGIIMLKGWPQSRGACVEIQHAMTMHWPIYYYDQFTLVSMNKDEE